jgi:hypothetical protein
VIDKSPNAVRRVLSVGPSTEGLGIAQGHYAVRFTRSAMAARLSWSISMNSGSLRQRSAARSLARYQPSISSRTAS